MSIEFVNKSPRVILLASGEQTRWDGVGPKQLAPVDGEPVLLRTLRQIKQYVATQPILVSQSDELADAVAGRAKVLVLPRGQRRWTAETALHSHSAWGDPTWILLADVYWTDRAIERMMAVPVPNWPQYFISTGYQTSEKVLGLWRRRRELARRVGDKPWDEILGLRFRGQNYELMADCFQRAVVDAERGGRGKLWESYRSLCGFPLRRHRLEERHRMDVVDGSMDFDTVDEYVEFLAERTRLAA